MRGVTQCRGRLKSKRELSKEWFPFGEKKMADSSYRVSNRQSFELFNDKVDLDKLVTGVISQFYVRNAPDVQNKRQVDLLILINVGATARTQHFEICCSLASCRNLLVTHAKKVKT